ncbi:MAG: NAD(P)/FAD-dependent oxidoreductase, partial [Calditrichaeota bacterium]
MKRLVILGGGTAGTIMANKLRPRLDEDEWQMTLVDENSIHYYQPGFLFIPFGIYTKREVVKPRRRFIPRGVQFILSPVEEIKAQENKVVLGSGEVLPYDVLIIATGSQIHPEETEGMLEAGWHENIFDFYTLEGALALHQRLQRWEGGRLVIHINEMPIKCPVAPLEFAFLVDWWLGERGLRKKTELFYVTPLDGAFTKPVASRLLGDTLAQRGIQLIPEFNVARVDGEKNKLISWDDREVEYDLLVTIPTNMGAEVIARSGL